MSTKPALLVLWSVLFVWPAGAALPASFAPLQKVLEGYDPILANDLVLEGTLQFPEVEKALPVFYRQLMERVSIHLTVSREGVEVEPRGKNEELKEMVRQQFLLMEKELSGCVRQILDNDPVYRLRDMSDNAHRYEARLEEASGAAKSFSFVRSAQSPPRSRLPDKVSFTVGPAGDLSLLEVADRELRLRIRLESELVSGKRYVTGIAVSMNRGGSESFRTLAVQYATRDGLRYPARLTVTDVDAQGNPLKTSGNLNPVHLVFDLVQVRRR